MRNKIMVQVEVDLDYLAEAAVVAQRRGKNVQEVVNKLVEDALYKYSVDNQPKLKK